MGVQYRLFKLFFGFLAVNSVLEYFNPQHDAKTAFITYHYTSAILHDIG
jgi:hypothetical protein